MLDMLYKKSSNTDFLCDVKCDDLSTLKKKHITCITVRSSACYCSLVHKQSSPKCISQFDFIDSTWSKARF